jgi:hypothetical protein
MSIIQVIIWAIVAYFVYKFLIGFVFPLIKVTRQMKRQVREFKRHVEHQQPQQRSPNTHTSTPTKEKTGDYIDFEEV